MIRSDDEADYATMRDRFRDLCTAAALATDTTVEVTFSGLARTMRNNRVLAERFRANMTAYGIEDQGDDPNAGLDRHGQRQLGLPDDPPGPRHRAGGDARSLDPVPRRGRHAARRRDDAAGRDPRRPDGTRPVPRSRTSSRPPGGEFREIG